jgi:hypothetical protein
MKSIFPVVTIVAALFAFSLTNVQAGYPTIASAPLWGGPTQHHVDLVMEVGDYVPDTTPSLYFANTLDYTPLYVPLIWEQLFRPDPTGRTASTLPGDVEPMLQILKPDGTRVAIQHAQVVTCNKSEGAGYYSLWAGQTCWLRATVDTTGPVVATLSFPKNRAEVLQVVRASLEVKDVNETPLARAELR